MYCAGRESWESKDFVKHLAIVSVTVAVALLLMLVLMTMMVMVVMLCALSDACQGGRV